MKQPRIL